MAVQTSHISGIQELHVTSDCHVGQCNYRLLTGLSLYFSLIRKPPLPVLNASDEVPLLSISVISPDSPWIELRAETGSCVTIKSLVLLVGTRYIYPELGKGSR